MKKFLILFCLLLCSCDDKNLKIYELPATVVSKEVTYNTYYVKLEVNNVPELNRLYQLDNLGEFMRTKVGDQVTLIIREKYFVDGAPVYDYYVKLQEVEK